MDTLKFHFLTTTAVIFAGYITAFTSVMIIENTLFSNVASISGTPVQIEESNSKASLPNIEPIIESNFFEKPDPEDITTEIAEEVPQLNVDDLTLLGTITGPRSIAQAIILKKGEPQAQIFSLNKSVKGYDFEIIKIETTKVTIRVGDDTALIDMYPPEKKPGSSTQRTSTATTISAEESERVAKTISRAELTQDLQNNMDNMLKGIRAGPYRQNGEVVGYSLKTVSSQNILYKFGLRSGDILRRINGHPITSTAKLFELWQSFPKESRVVIDIQRGKNFKTFDFTIND
jgi:general secretion pathway protein C